MHEFRIVADTLGAVAETSEVNNGWTGSVQVVEGTGTVDVPPGDVVSQRRFVFVVVTVFIQSETHEYFEIVSARIVLTVSVDEHAQVVILQKVDRPGERLYDGPLITRLQIVDPDQHRLFARLLNALSQPRLASYCSRGNLVVRIFLVVDRCNLEV